jgi:hypothetical protein
MKSAVRIALLVMLLAALPLRGYAGELMVLCEAHHGGAATAQEHVHEHGDSLHEDSGDGGGVPAHAASVCSICASCCAGANLAPDAPRVAVFQAQGSGRVAFLDRRAAGFVPAQLDRPPLVS